MSLTDNSSFQTAIGKFFINSTYIISRKWESNVFWTQDAEMSLGAIRLFESAREEFFMNSTYNMSR